MVDLNDVFFDCPGSNYAILLNGKWQHTVTFIVEMLADEVDSSWSPDNNLWLSMIDILEFLSDMVVSGLLI